MPLFLIRDSRYRWEWADKADDQFVPFSLVHGGSNRVFILVPHRYKLVLAHELPLAQKDRKKIGR
jgi:hypothetical protein